MDMLYPYLLKFSVFEKYPQDCKDERLYRELVRWLIRQSYFTDHVTTIFGNPVSRSVREAREKIIQIRERKYNDRLVDWTDPKTLTKKRRAWVYEYYKGICQICGRQIFPREPYHIHHIDRNRRNNHLGNLVLLCPSCHRKFHAGKVALRSKKPLRAPLTQSQKCEQTSILSWQSEGGD